MYRADDYRAISRDSGALLGVFPVHAGCVHRLRDRARSRGRKSPRMCLALWAPGEAGIRALWLPDEFAKYRDRRVTVGRSCRELWVPVVSIKSCWALYKIYK